MLLELLLTDIGQPDTTSTEVIFLDTKGDTVDQELPGLLEAHIRLEVGLGVAGQVGSTRSGHVVGGSWDDGSSRRDGVDLRAVLLIPAADDQG